MTPPRNDQRSPDDRPPIYPRDWRGLGWLAVVVAMMMIGYLLIVFAMMGAL